MPQAGQVPGLSARNDAEPGTATNSLGTASGGIGAGGGTADAAVAGIGGKGGKANGNVGADGSAGQTAL